MDHHQYSKRLDGLQEATTTNLISLAQWVRLEALPWLWTEMAGVILPPKTQHPLAKKPPRPGKLTPMRDEEAVREGLRLSLADRVKKAKEPGFYRAQLTMLHSEATLYCDAIDAIATAKSSDTVIFAEDATVHTVHGALQEMMRYARILLEAASYGITGVPGRYAAWSRQHDDPVEVFLGTRRIVYGAYSAGLAHADRAPYAPVAVLRTAIELRIRDAFCISSYMDQKSPDRVVPIDMSRLFEAIETQQNAIDIAVNLHDVKRIYRWSNAYLHAGVRDYPWVAGFLLRFVGPLFVDQRKGPDGSLSMYGGIRMKRETWQAVRATLVPVAESVTIKQRIINAWRALWAEHKPPLQLPPVEERAAKCMFVE